MSVLQTTATGASRPVNARRVRGWVRGGAVGIFGLWLFNTLGGDESGPLLDLARLTGLEAGYAVLAALLLMARIPALDRQVAHLAQVPPREHRAEAVPLAEELEKIEQGRRRGPQLLADILPIVLARLGVGGVQSTASGEPDPS